LECRDEILKLDIGPQETKYITMKAGYMTDGCRQMATVHKESI